ncbi:MAG TPA: SprT-like domain-containing protein [Candidatus Acidoferrales bacterium]|nr:SprT-like domain-containing protein [Candidatus Acidoferrales bacterium]
MKANSRRPRPVPGGAMLFQRMYTRLDCDGRPPHFIVDFYPYANLAHSIRLRRDTAYVRLSDLLQNAPLEVLEAAAAILLSRLYRRRLPSEISEMYRKYAQARSTRRKLHTLRQTRARRKMRPPQGRVHNLEPLFETLNRRYFSGELPKSKIGWSTHRWRSQLGIFDPALDQIIINSALDRPQVPEYAVAYVLFHEMLHRKHPIKLARCRLEAHSREFRLEEKQFSDYNRAMKFLKRFS